MKSTLTEYYQNIIIEKNHQDFSAAVQQSADYRDRLVAYQAAHTEIEPDADSAAMLEMMDTAVSTLSSVYNSFLSFGATPAIIEPLASSHKPIAAPQEDVPTLEELARLCHIRDAAFFEYMHSLNLDAAQEIHDFEPDETRLTATDELTRPYRNASNALLSEMQTISESISTTLATQRTWLDFIIESICPSFVLKAMHYMNFQALTKEKISALSQKFSNLAQSLEIIETAFHKAWAINYPNMTVPSNLKAACSTTLHKFVGRIDHAELSRVYFEYNRNKTVNNLLNMYRLAHQLQHQATQNEEQHIMIGQLEGIISQIEQLHPDMRTYLEKEQAIVAQELELFEKHSVLPDTNAPLATFLVHLTEKYGEFLRARTLENFSALYQHIHRHPEYKHRKQVKDTRALLKALYPEAYQAVRQHQIAHIDEQACDAFLKKYETMNYDHPIYKGLIAFMHEPTYAKLIALEQVMPIISDNEHHLDPRLSAAISEFMQICSNVSTINTVEDCISDNYSDSTDEAPISVADERRPSMDMLDEQATTTDSEIQPLSMQNLAAQNKQFATMNHFSTSQHSLFASVQHTRLLTESKAMLKEYLAYRAQVNSELDTTLESLQALSTAKSNGIVSSFTVMASYLFHPVVALACILIGKGKEASSIKSLSTKRNQLREALYTMEKDFQATWKEKFGRPAPMQASDVQAYIHADVQDDQIDETSRLLGDSRVKA